MTAIREAIVLADPGRVDVPVAGVPYLLRTLLALQRAGIERCTVIGAAVPADRRVRLAAASAPAFTPPADDALRLVVGPCAVIDERLVRDLEGRAQSGCVMEVAAGGARVRVAPGALVASNGAVAEPPRVGTLEPLDAPPRRLETSLLRGLENPRDGWLDRILFRHLSRPATRRLLPTGVPANAVTVAAILVGVAGGLLLGAPHPALVALGIAALDVSGVLDCSDGELARLRFAESRLGHCLDITGDTAVHAAVLGGIVLGLRASGRVPGVPTLVALALGVLGAFAVVTWSELTEDRRHRVGGWENRILDGVLGPLSTRDWHVFVVAFALAGRLDVLVLGGAVGAHVFWLTGLLLVGRVLRRGR
jgi:phosphatidylglycerophosphate synthase